MSHPPAGYSLLGKETAEDIGACPMCDSLKDFLDGRPAAAPSRKFTCEFANTFTTQAFPCVIDDYARRGGATSPNLRRSCDISTTPVTEDSLKPRIRGAIEMARITTHQLSDAIADDATDQHVEVIRTPPPSLGAHWKPQSHANKVESPERLRK